MILNVWEGICSDLHVTSFLTSVVRILLNYTVFDFLILKIFIYLLFIFVFIF